MIGIYNRFKELKYNGEMTVCSSCGRYCSYKILVEYTCLSLFFIPVAKWGKRYYAVSTCCGKKKDLTKEQGKKVEKGEKIILS